MDVVSTVPPGSQISATLTVGAVGYAVQPMDGSPRTAASGPAADFGLGDAPAAGSMAGKVCVIQRGTISFADKVLSCQSSGGVAAVIYNNTTGDLLGTVTGGAAVPRIPSVGALQADGPALLAQVGATASVSCRRRLPTIASTPSAAAANPCSATPPPAR